MTRTATIVVATTVGAAMLTRAIKRSLSPEICCSFRCECGRIEGEIRCKREDSIRITCHCADCRRYAACIASLPGRSDELDGDDGDDSNLIDERRARDYCGRHCTRVVQVCKSAVTVARGRHLIKLARKGPPRPSSSKDEKKRQVYMHRFFAGCCSVPLFNTVDFLGFVGVYTDRLVDGDEAAQKFDGPVRMFPEEALSPPIVEEPDVFAPVFLWKLVRYQPWYRSGPFDYDQKPDIYWGSFEGGEETGATGKEGNNSLLGHDRLGSK